VEEKRVLGFNGLLYSKDLKELKAAGFTTHFLAQALGMSREACIRNLRKSDDHVVHVKNSACEKFWNNLSRFRLNGEPMEFSVLQVSRARGMRANRILEALRLQEQGHMNKAKAVLSREGPIFREYARSHARLCLDELCKMTVELDYGHLCKRAE
jgi:hypothetical protein